MKKLKRRTEVLLLAMGLCMTFTAMAHVYHKTQLMFLVSIIINIIVMCFLLGFLTVTYKGLITAKLIADNRILSIEQAQVIWSAKNRLRKVTEKEVIISCFGILLGSRVIKYNLDGISLMAVELGDEFISVTYGAERKKQKIRILHERMRVQDLIRITEKFRYETGITPVLTDR